MPTKEELIATGTAILAAAQPQLTQARGFIDVVINIVGKIPMACYALFFLATILFPFSKIFFISISAYQIASQLNISLLLYIAYLSFLLPVFWKKPAAWIGLSIPFFVFVYIWYAYVSMVGDFSSKFGLWLSCGSSMYLALVGFKNMTQNKPT